eukprot:8436977-Alexandrium_andersonii.AAC.1
MTNIVTINDYGHFAGPKYWKPCGVPQGDPLSMCWLCLLMRPAMLLMKEQGIVPRMLADDVNATTVGPRAWTKLKRGGNALRRFFAAVGAKASPRKSRLFSTSRSVRCMMREHVWPELQSKMPICGGGRDLGSHLSVHKRLSSATLRVRMRRAGE